MMRARWRGETLGLRLRRLEVLGRAAGREHHAGRLGRDRGADRLDPRSLHDDGHRVDDDVGGRGAGRDAAGRRVDPRRRLRPPAHGGRVGPPDRVAADVAAHRSSRSRTRSRVVLALGGSTNAVIHLIAMAGRAGVPLALDRFDELSRRVPRAREHPAVRQVPDAGLLRGGRPARADGPARPARRDDRRRARRSRRTLRGAEVFDDDVIRPRSNPLSRRGRPGDPPRDHWRPTAA